VIESWRASKVRTIVAKRFTPYVITLAKRSGTRRYTSWGKCYVIQCLIATKHGDKQMPPASNCNYCLPRSFLYQEQPTQYEISRMQCLISTCVSHIHIGCLGRFRVLLISSVCVSRIYDADDDDDDNSLMAHRR
jgi:hypothetical protein